MALTIFAIILGWCVDRRWLLNQASTESTQHLDVGAILANLDNVERKLTERSFNDESRVLSLLLELAENRSEFNEITLGWSAKTHVARLLHLQNLSTPEDVFEWAQRVASESQMGLLEFRTSEVLVDGSPEQIQLVNLLKDGFSAMADEKFIRWKNDPGSIMF